jgi:cobalt-zinc-cadmium efflux system outer membrane protein
MRRTRVLCLAVGCVIWSAGVSFSQTAVSDSVQALSERDLLASFRANDPRMQAIDRRVDEVRAFHAERTLFPNPSASYSRESVFDTDDTFLVARQELPISGRRERLRTAGRFATEAALAQAHSERMQLQAEARAAYADLLLAQEREAAVNSAMAALQNLISMLRAREKEGEGSTYDRMRGERALIDLEADLSLAAAARVKAQGQVASFLGTQVLPETLKAGDTLDSPPEPPPVTALIDEALSSRGDYRAAERSVQQFAAERDAASRLRLPTPTIVGGLKRSTSGALASSGYQFSVDLSLPLFSHGQAASALAAAHRARAEAEAAAWRIRIEAEVRAARTLLALQRQRAQAYRLAVTGTAEPLVQVGRVGYEEGELGILELLDAERQAVDARIRALELAAEARRAAIELDRVIGREWRP